ncbi:probable cytochrome P450 49a1 [Penaeus japonicus]|uniref:probable cytochrome P450 49a1 n=1 Tax=Penaeus japonicus TaxID=27405 RepID=UPI001C70FDD8|nr:probable cytochrome P450 49a1 [Penaeus japonicus]
MNLLGLTRRVAGGGQLALKQLARTTSTSASGRQTHAVAATFEGEKTRPRPVSEVPGPPIFPVMGSIPAMMTYREFYQNKIHQIFFKMIDQYGPIVQIKMPNWSQGVLVTKPEDKETVLRATKDNPLRDALPSLKKVRDETIDNFFDKNGGLLTEQGDKWWRVRKGVQTPMMKRKNVEAYLPEVDAITLQFMDRIASLQKERGEMPEDFLQEMYKWAFESVSVVALSRRLGCLDPHLSPDSEPMRIIQIVSELFKTLNACEFTGPLWKIYPTPTFKKLKRMHQKLLEIALTNIKATEAALQEALKEPGAEDRELTLMEQLLLRPELNYKDVVTLILDMIFAGIDTTSHTMAFTLYLLAKNPEAQRKLQQEVDQALKDDPRTLTPTHIAKLSYAKAVVKESLRMFPVAMGFMRQLSTDVVLSGYHIPKGSSVLMLNYEDAQKDTAFPRPREFLPERWLRGNELASSHAFALLPFGAGTRMCIGRRLAEQEMYVFLARVMQRYNVNYNYGDMDSTMQLILKPSQPLKFSFTERRA